MASPQTRFFDDRASAAAGLIMPPLFGFVVLLQDLFRDDFDSLRRFISELAIGPLGWIQIVNFLVSGTLVVFLARAALLQFSAKVARIASYLLAVIGGSMFFSGVFVADPQGAAPGQGTWHGALHLVCGLTVFTLIPASCLMFLWYFWRDEDWHELRLWTLITVLVAGSFWIALIPGSAIPPISSVLEPIYGRLGLANRVVVGTWLAWLFLFALHTRRHIVQRS